MQQKTKLKFHWQSQEHSWQELKEAEAALGAAELWMLLCTHASSEAKHQVFFICNYFLSFFHLKFPEMLNFPNYIINALLKPNLNTSLKQFFKGVVHEQPWYTIVWFVWGYTIVSSCFLRWFCFLTFPLHFPLLKFMSFIFSITFFYVEFSEMLNFPKFMMPY